MGNAAIDIAAEGLLAIGLPVPPASFLEQLINEGEDVQPVVSRLVSVIGALGGNPELILEEVAYGMEHNGPVAYVQQLVDQHFAPAIQVVQDIHRSKTTVIDIHHATLTKTTALVTTLTAYNESGGPMMFTGLAADAMNARYADISTQVTRLVDAMDQSRQIDEDLFTQLTITMRVGMGMAVVDLALVAIGLILAPATAGGSLAIAGIVDVGLLSAEATILLGAVIGCFIVWGLRHALLTISTSLSHPVSTGSHPTATGNTGVIIHEINLTKYPELDPQQQAAADDLFREFNGGVQDTWIEYMMHVLGLKNISPAVAKQVIRCLRTKGYLDIGGRMKSEGVNPASKGNAGLTGDFKTAWNAIMDQLNPRTLQGAWAERNNIDTTIPDLGPKDHITKVNNGIKAVEKCIASLDANIADYRTPPGLRAFYQTVKKALENTRDVANGLRKGNRSQGPSTWEDPKGEVPFGKDLIEASGCLPA